jgi:hypothetical protein
MKLKKLLANIAGVVGLFFAFIFPVSRMVFSLTGEKIVDRVTSWLGIFRNAEPGDSLIATFILISFLLSVSVVSLVNLFVNRINKISKMSNDIF